jgi:hypothetical protein
MYDKAPVKNLEKAILSGRPLRSKRERLIQQYAGVRSSSVCPHSVCLHSRFSQNFRQHALLLKGIGYDLTRNGIISLTGTTYEALAATIVLACGTTKPNKISLSHHRQS